MSRCTLLLVWSAAWVSAQVRLEAPRVGFVQDARGRLSCVYGVAGNLLLGESFFEGVAAAASSGRWTLVKLGTELLLLDEGGAVAARWTAPRGAARFAFTPAGEPALVYFPETGELWRIGREGLFVAATLDEDPLAVGWVDPERSALIVRRPGGLWLRTVSLQTGHSEHESPVADSADAAFLAPGGSIVYGQGSKLCLRFADAPERWLRLPAPAETFAQIGSQWVEIRLAGNAGRLLLRLHPESVGLYRLPEVER